MNEDALAGLERRLSGRLNLRRDLYLFVDLVRREGLKRAHRTNDIPKGPALKLARILSWEGEESWVKSEGSGLWSDLVSRLARSLGLVSFNVEGVYKGYTSMEPSFPDNEIEVEARAVAAWLARSPVQKEKAILEKLVDDTGNEFFRSSTLHRGDARFDSLGCGIGPASRMPLGTIRRTLLGLLADQPHGVWIPVSVFVDLVRTSARDLILPPSLKKKPLSDYDRDRVRRGGKVSEEVEGRYSNFRERVKDQWGREGTQLTESTPNVFDRVEGRYLQYFLQEIPFLSGFVDLAMAPESRETIWPPRESVRAFRTTSRLRQVVHGDPSLGRVSVTVLPTLEVLVEAPSWPERELEALRPFCEEVEEDGPIHRLRIDRKKTVAHAAANPKGASPREVLSRLSSRPLPSNVEVELDAAVGHSRKLTLYEDVALVEIRLPEDRDAVTAELGKFSFDASPRGFVLSRNPRKTLDVLEQCLRIPTSVKHLEKRFAACDGPLGASTPKSPAGPAPAPRPRRKVKLSMTDVVAYRSGDAELLAELQNGLARAGKPGRLFPEEGLLLVAAADLPRLRALLTRLASRFDIVLERADSGIAS